MSLANGLVFWAAVAHKKWNSEDQILPVFSTILVKNWSLGTLFKKSFYQLMGRRWGRRRFPQTEAEWNWHMGVRELEERKLVFEHHPALAHCCSHCEKNTCWLVEWEDTQAQTLTQRPPEVKAPEVCLCSYTTSLAWILGEPAGSALPLLPVSSILLKSFNLKTPLNASWQFSICHLRIPPHSTPH